jgi:hypothetical protein
VDHLDDILRVRQQLAAALAALPHDFDEACQRLLAADADLAALQVEAERRQNEMDAYMDACEAEAAEEVLP